MTIKLGDVDKNFVQETTLGLDNIVYHNIKDNPFKIYGADDDTFKKEGLWRISEDLLNKCPWHEWGAHCTTGFRVRFKTNSEYVAIKVKFVNEIDIEYKAGNRMACDLYRDYKNQSRFVKRFTPPGNVVDGYEGVVHFSSNEDKYLTLNLLTYEMVKEVYIGLEKGATIEAGLEYEDVKPIVYYGSSITQGGTCHRPGNTYQAIINRRNNIDYKNLGFSGRAKAEVEVMEYLANLDMSVFVYCPLNIHDLDELRSVHPRGYKIVRDKNPDLPIIIITTPHSVANEADDVDYTYKRRIVEMKTYIEAYESGDKNVYLIDGWQFFNFPEGDGCTTDGAHPSDLGFMHIADIVGNEIDTILRKRL